MEVISIENTKLALKAAVKCLKEGGILIFPTETAYGVGVDATNAEAVTRLLSYKKRPEGKAISIGVSSKAMAKDYVDINKVASNLYDNFLPGALTVISQSKHKTDNRLESEQGTLGIRIPNYKFILDVIESFGKPITTTSANSSGKKTPYSIEDILNNISKKQEGLIDVIIDAGELPHNPPSTVIDTTSEELTIHRQGRIDPNKMQNSEAFFSTSTKETIEIGNKIIKQYSLLLKSKPLIILLNGELGAGKTHLTKGIAKELGIDRVIKSPTYNYVNEYKLPDRSESKLYHFDAWKIQNEQDLQALKFHGWFKPGNIIVIEWPSVIMNLDPSFFETLEYLYVDFIINNDTEREIRIYK